MLTHDDIRKHIVALTRARDEFDLMIAEQYTPYKSDPNADILKQHGLLQMFQFAANTPQHLDRLISYLELHATDHVLDLGCGTGSLADWIMVHRPAVGVTLLNRSLAQLSCCAPTSARVAGDMQVLPFHNGTFDAVILAYSLGYGLVDDVLAESARVLKPWGQLLLYDLVCRNGPANYLLVTLGYKVYSWARLLEAARLVGLRLTIRESVPTQYPHPAFHALPEWLQHAFLAESEPMCVVFRRHVRDDR
jgi:SAM-dependent methyltransferase